MARFKQLSIKGKLVAISMLTSSVVMVLSLFVVFIGAYYTTRTSTQEQISSLARVVGTNCEAAIAFDDPDAAKETLKALIAEPQVTYARIYKVDGSVFAAYYRADQKNASVQAGVESNAPEMVARLIKSSAALKYRFYEGRLEVVESIDLDRKIIGVVEVVSDLKQLYYRMKSIGSICVVILLLSSILAYIISTLAQRTISGPITNLTEIMNSVSRDKDYGVRGTYVSRDELGTLYSGFNEMLSEIQARDEKLHFTQFSIDHMGDAAFWIDTRGYIVNVNRAACKSVGLTKKDLLGLPIGEVDPAYGGERWHELWKKVRRNKAHTFESTYLRKDGELFPVEVYANYLEFKGQEYACAFVRNIADRKRLQFQLEQAQKMEAIGTLAGGVAHDLNNILGGLVGYPDLLLMDLPEDSPMRVPLTTVKKSGEKAAAIVQDMLTLARRGVDVQTAVNLNDIVDEYLQSPEHEKVTGFYRSILFDIQLDPDLPNILGSEIHLSKTLMNLVSNGAEAISQEGGRICISTFKKHLDGPLNGFQTIAEGDYAVLRIEDSGVGLSADEMTNIFEPFYTKKKMGRSGTGLGMSVVSSTVKDHKGYINLISTVGQGTCFELYFPVTHQVIQDKTNHFSMEDYMGKESVLVIDDVPEQREVATIILCKLGYRVATVASGEAALAHIEKEPSDLLLLDMIMDPGIDGLETYRQILKINPGQKAVIASGYAETDRVREVIRMGAGAFVRKPYSLERLGVAVREVLDK